MKSFKDHMLKRVDSIQRVDQIAEEFFRRFGGVGLGHKSRIQLGWKIRIRFSSTADLHKAHEIACKWASELSGKAASRYSQHSHYWNVDGVLLEINSEGYSEDVMWVRVTTG